MSTLTFQKLWPVYPLLSWVTHKCRFDIAVRSFDTITIYIHWIGVDIRVHVRFRSTSPYHNRHVIILVQCRISDIEIISISLTNVNGNATLLHSAVIKQRTIAGKSLNLKSKCRRGRKIENVCSNYWKSKNLADKQIYTANVFPMVFKLAKLETQKFHGRIKVAVNALPTDNLFCCFIFQCLLAFALHSFLYRSFIIIVFKFAISAYVSSWLKRKNSTKSTCTSLTQLPRTPTRRSESKLPFFCRANDP